MVVCSFSVGSLENLPLLSEIPLKVGMFNLLYYTYEHYILNRYDLAILGSS